MIHSQFKLNIPAKDVGNEKGFSRQTLPNEFGVPAVALLPA